MEVPRPMEAADLRHRRGLPTDAVHARVQHPLAEGNDWTPGTSYSRNKQLGFLPHKVKPVTVIFKAMPNEEVQGDGQLRRSGGGSRPRPSSTPPDELQRSGEEVARALALHPLGLTLVRHPVIDFDVEAAIMNSKLGQLQQVPIDREDLRHWWSTDCKVGTVLQRIA